MAQGREREIAQHREREMAQRRESGNREGGDQPNPVLVRQMEERIRMLEGEVRKRDHMIEEMRRHIAHQNGEKGSEREGQLERRLGQMHENMENMQRQMEQMQRTIKELHTPR
jgi:polyhydroxyalkanoate synthesis regulator protein